MATDTTPLPGRSLQAPIRSCLQTDFITLDRKMTVLQALDSIRHQGRGQKIIYFYVLDADGRLCGVLPTRRLLLSSPDMSLETLMLRQVISIPDTMTVADACEFFVMHRLLAFPVVDADNHMVGIVDIGMFTDEMFDAGSFRTERDVFQLIGMHLSDARAQSPAAAFKDRFPWLLCNIAGGLACALLSGFYDQLLDAVILLAMFIPVVLALAESVSMQAMTLTLQTLRQHIGWPRLLAALGRELATALLLGLASGLTVGLAALAWKRQSAVALAIGLSIALSIVTACLLGVLLPTLVRWLRGDPKVAAGPVVLATADLATLLFYFNLSRWLLT
jgi:magnesium transporter